MANNEQTMILRIQADTDRATRRLRSMDREIVRLSRDLRRSQHAGSGFASSFRGLAGVTAGLVGINTAMQGISSAAATIIDFEKSIDDLAAVSNSSAKEIAALEVEAKKLGGSTQYSASQVAEGMNSLAMAGFDTKDILDATAGTLNLASVGNIELADSADIASNVLSGFGLQAKETDRVVDVMAATVTNANTNIIDMGSAMSKVAPIAKQYGVSLEETSAAIGVLADSGIKAEIAGTQLKITLSRLAADSGTAKALKSLGISAYDAEGNFKSLRKILHELSPALDKLSQKEKNIKLVDIFGKNALASANVLLDKVDTLDSRYTQLQNSQGEASRIAKQKIDNLAGSQKEFGSALESVILKFSDLIPIMRDATDGATGFLQSITQEDVDPFVKALTDLYDTVKFTGKALIGLVPTDFSSSMYDSAISVFPFLDVFGQLGDALNDTANAAKYWDAVINGSTDLAEQATKVDKLTEATNKFTGTKDQYKELKDSILSTFEENKKLIDSYSKTPAGSDAVSGLINQQNQLNDALENLVKNKNPYAELEQSSKKSIEELTTDLQVANDKRLATAEATKSKLVAQEQKLSDEIKKINDKLMSDLAVIEERRYAKNKNLDEAIYKTQTANKSEVEKNSLDITRMYDKVSEARQFAEAGDLEKAKVSAAEAESIARSLTDKKIAMTKEVEQYVQRQYAKTELYMQKNGELAALNADKEVKQQEVILQSSQKSIDVKTQGLLAIKNLTDILAKAESDNAIAASAKQAEVAQAKMKAIQDQISSTNKLIDASKKLADALSKGLTVDDTEVKRLKKLLDDMTKPMKSKLTVDSNAPKVQSQLDKLDGRVTRSTHIIKTVQAKSGGGVVQKLATGGTFTGSGRVPGYDSTDSDKVNAKLTGGEFVVKRSAVKAIGLDMLHKINSKKFSVPGFSEGGQVGASSSTTTNSGNMATINLNIGAKTFTVMSPKEVADALQKHLENEGGE